eukprot:14876982-Alexandrium_andersonii.AAC.1
MGYCLYATGPDAKAMSAAGGVAVAVRMPVGATQLNPETDDFKRRVDLGRAVLALAALTPHYPVMVVCAYGWASDGEVAKHARADAMLQAIKSD